MRPRLEPRVLRRRGCAALNFCDAGESEELRQAPFLLSMFLLEAVSMVSCAATQP
jgi:hypothetical protein